MQEPSRLDAELADIEAASATFFDLYHFATDVQSIPGVEAVHRILYPQCECGHSGRPCAVVDSLTADEQRMLGRAHDFIERFLCAASALSLSAEVREAITRAFVGSHEEYERFNLGSWVDFLHDAHDSILDVADAPFDTLDAESIAMAWAPIRSMMAGWTMPRESLVRTVYDRTAAKARAEWPKSPKDPSEPATAKGEGERKAESKAENLGRKSARKRAAVPANPDVIRLARELNRPENRERDWVEIAREFTEYDEPKAQNLLRQCRTYRDVLNLPHG